MKRTRLLVEPSSCYKSLCCCNKVGLVSPQFLARQDEKPLHTQYNLSVEIRVQLDTVKSQFLWLQVKRGAQTIRILKTCPIIIARVFEKKCAIRRVRVAGPQPSNLIVENFRPMKLL